MINGQGLTVEMFGLFIKIFTIKFPSNHKRTENVFRLKSFIMAVLSKAVVGAGKKKKHLPIMMVVPF